MAATEADAEIFLRGEHTRLRPLRATDVDGPYLGWLNDADICRYNSHHVFPYTREQALRFVESMRNSRTDMVFAVEDLGSGKHIGNIALQSIHQVNRSAELSFLLGDRDFWGRGIGTEAGRLVLTHAFDGLNLHRVGCGTSDDNTAMRKLASRLGMREEGRRRAGLWKSGSYVDVIEYGILAPEHRSMSDQPAAK